MTTPLDKMKARLEQTGIPAKEIKCYGSQIMVTAFGRPAAEKWFLLLSQFCSTVRGPLESTDDCKVNNDPRRSQKFVTVYRVWGTI